MIRTLALSTVALVSGCVAGLDPPPITGMVLVDGSQPFWYGPLEPCVGSTYGNPLCKVEVWKDMEKANAEPPLRLQIPSFYLDAHEVTNEQYEFCVEMRGCTKPLANNGANENVNIDYYDADDRAFDQHPVVQITQQQAADYCQWLGKRLPTEFEWERAAKGPGETKRLWPAEDLGDAVNECISLGLPALACGQLANAQRAPAVDANGEYPIASNAAIKDYVLEGGKPIYHLFGNVSEWTSSRLREGNTCLEALPTGCDPTWQKPTLTSINRCLGTCNQVGLTCGDWGTPYDPSSGDNCSNAEDLYDPSGPGPEDSACYYRCTTGDPEDVLAPVCGYNPGSKVHQPDELLDPANSIDIVIKGGSAQVPDGSICSLMSSARDMYLRKGIGAKQIKVDNYVGFRCALDANQTPPTAYPPAPE